MANSLSGFLQVYANEALPQLIAGSPLLSSFTTDFSSDASAGGSAVVTRLPTSTLTANDTSANGYVAINATSSAVTITMKQRDITHQFSELEWQNGASDKILNTFVPSMVRGLVNIISNDIMSTITVANYATVLSGSAAAFSGSAAIRVAQLMSTANVPTGERSLIILPTYFESLVNSVSPAYSYGNADAVQNYRVMNYAGFSPVVEYSNIPTNGENLTGFGAHKSALAVATRVPAVGNNFPGEVTTVTDPKSGFSVQFRAWHSADDGKFKLAATAVYGFAKGNGAALVRLSN